MNNLLRNAAGGVRLGLWASVIGIIQGMGSHWLFGDEFRWGPELSTAATMPVLFGVGGLIYGFLLPAFARDRMDPPARARLLAGLAAGALTSALATSPYLLREPQPGHMSHAGFMLMFIVLGMGVGSVCAFLYRPAAPHTPSPDLTVHSRSPMGR
jgi:hypothetical protein